MVYSNGVPSFMDITFDDKYMASGIIVVPLMIALGFIIHFLNSISIEDKDCSYDNHMETFLTSITDKDLSHTKRKSPRTRRRNK